jgi:hypothetical protein
MRGGLLGAHEYHMAKVCQADSISIEDLIVGEIQSDGGIRLKVGRCLSSIADPLFLAVREMTQRLSS